MAKKKNGSKNYLLAYCFIGLGAVNVLIGFWQTGSFYYQQTWPTIMGVVEQAEVINAGSGSSARGRPGGNAYYTIITYTYQVENEQYHHRQKIQVLGFQGVAQKLVKAVKLYPEVHYNPHRPSESTIDRGHPAVPLAVIFFGGLFTVVGWRVYGFRSSPPQRHRSQTDAGST